MHWERSDYKFYFGQYTPGPHSNFGAIQQFVNSNAAFFPGDPESDRITNDPNHFDTAERVIAGYAMNTITFGRARLQGGVRFEGTQGSFTGTRCF